MRVRKVTPKQCELLIDFAEANRDFTLGRTPVTESAHEAWRAVTQKLNSAGELQKTPEQWRRYWIEFKAKTKMKAADTRRINIGVSRPKGLIPLTNFERRTLALMGQVPLEDITDYKPEEMDAMHSAAKLRQEIKREKQKRKPSVQRRVSRPAEMPTCSIKVELETQSDRQCMTPTSDIDIPSWVHQLESRRLAAEERQADSLARIATVLEKLETFLHSKFPDYGGE